MNCEKSFFAPAPPPYRGRRGGSSTFSATIFAGDTLFRPHKPRSYVSHASSGRIPFRLLVCRLLRDADAVVRRSLVVAGMGKKSLIKSGDGDGGGGDAVLSLPPPKICMQMKSRYASRADVGGRTRTESN